MTAVRIRRPDDWHVHLRDGAMMQAVLPYTARHFARAIVMPNLKPPLTTVLAAAEYRARILEALPPELSFQPLMTAYLCDGSEPDEIQRGHEEGVFTAVKLYPAGATTHSEFGVTSVSKVARVLDTMQRIGMPLLIHGEVVDPEVDVFDREKVFLDRVVAPLLRDFPQLKVVLEHITTKDAADFVIEQTGSRLAATITPHHLVLNRNALFAGGLRPHHYCLPVLKREVHRRALCRAATSGDPRFFLGTDSAPHLRALKEADCGCAGIFNAPTALQTYARVFDEEGALDRLEDFACLNGPKFYGLPVNQCFVTLEKVEGVVPDEVSVGPGEELLPFLHGERLGWRVLA